MGKIVVRSPTPPAEQYVHGAVMVVGGTGTLGTLMVQWLADKGVRHIPIVSRSGQLPASVQGLLVSGSSAAHQAAVTVVQCDASFRADAAELQGSCLGGVPLLAVLHAGGVLSDATFSNQTLASLRKVGGVVLVRRAMCSENDMFVWVFA